MIRLLAVLIFLLPTLVLATTTSGTYVSPTVITDWGAWTNPDSAKTSDDRHAAIAAGSGDSITAKTFNIDIPLYATVDSIDVKIEGNGGSATTSRRVFYVKLTKDGGVTVAGSTGTIDTLNQTTDAVTTLSGTSNGQVTRLWNTTWTAAEIVSSNFGVTIEKRTTLTGSTQNIDHIQIAVWWHVASATKADFYLGAGYGNEADMTSLNSSGAAANFGTSIQAIIADSGQGANGSQHTLIRWPNIADSLTSGNQYVTACTLFVRTYSNTNTNGIVKVARIRRSDWHEDQASWLNYKTATTWTTDGARDTTNDVDTIPRLEYPVDDFVAGSVTAIDITPLAQLMDNTDSALWRGGFMLYGVWTFADTWRDSIGFNSSQLLLISDDSTVGYTRPYIHVVTAADPPYDGTPRPNPFVTVYPVAQTGLGKLSTSLITKNLGHRLQTVGFDSVLILADSNTTGIHRMVTSSNGGTSFSHTTTNFPNSVSGTMYMFGDSGWVTTYLSSATLTKKIWKWKQMTSGIYDTILYPASRVGDMMAATDVSIFIPLPSGSLMGLVRPETGTTDSVLLIKSNGPHTQTSTWTEIDKGANLVGANAQICPLPEKGGMVWWSGDSLFWVDSVGGFDTLSSALTGFTAPTNTPAYICRSIIGVGDSSFLVAYQSAGGAISARLGHVSNVGAGSGTVVWDAATQTIEADANLPAPITQTTSGGIRFLSGNACPTLSRVLGSNTVFCFWFHWAVQPSGRTDVRYDNPRIVYKSSVDRGATWDASRLIILDTNTTNMPHTATGGVPNKKVGLFSTPYARTSGQKFQTWLAWSDSGSLAGADTIRLAKVNIFTDTGDVAFGRGADEALDNKLRQQFPTTNYGTDTAGYIGGFRADGNTYVYIATFPNLASNLINRTVDSAKLTLRMLSNPSMTNDTFGFQIVRQPTADSLWSETQSTWRLRKTGQDWRDSGASYATTDVKNSTLYSKFNHSSIVSASDMTVNVTELLKAMDGAASDTSSTFTIRIVGGDGSQPVFNTSNTLNISRRPYLRVWWHTGIEASGAATPTRRRREMGIKERIGAYSITGH